MQDAELRKIPRPKFDILPEIDSEKKSNAVFHLKVNSIVEKSSQEKMVKKDISYLLSNAEVLLRHEEKEMAKVLIYEALSENSYHPVALKKANEFLDTKKNLDQMIKTQKVLCQVDSCFETISQQGHYYYLNSQDELALEKYFESISLVVETTPALFEVYKNMGNILTKAGDFDGAEEYFNKAFVLQPQSDVLLVNLGTLDLQRQEVNSALDRFRMALELNPENDKAWVGLALVHQKMGDEILAYANVENAIDINPGNRTAVHIFANWSVRDAKLTAAIEKLENYLSTVDLDKELSLVLVHLFCQMNQFELALLEIERVLLWDPRCKDFASVEVEVRKLYSLEKTA